MNGKLLFKHQIRFPEALALSLSLFLFFLSVICATVPWMYMILNLHEIIIVRIIVLTWILVRIMRARIPIPVLSECDRPLVPSCHKLLFFPWPSLKSFCNTINLLFKFQSSSFSFFSFIQFITVFNSLYPFCLRTRIKLVIYFKSFLSLCTLFFTNLLISFISNWYLTEISKFLIPFLYFYIGRLKW